MSALRLPPTTGPVALTGRGPIRKRLHCQRLQRPKGRASRLSPAAQPPWLPLATWRPGCRAGGSSPAARPLWLPLATCSPGGRAGGLSPPPCSVERQMKSAAPPNSRSCDALICSPEPQTIARTLRPPPEHAMHYPQVRMVGSRVKWRQHAKNGQEPLIRPLARGPGRSHAWTAAPVRAIPTGIAPKPPATPWLFSPPHRICG